MCEDICKYYKPLGCKSFEECIELCKKGKRELGITDAKLKTL